MTSVVSQRHVVVVCCERALAAGVRPGMSLADARALLGASGAAHTRRGGGARAQGAEAGRHERPDAHASDADDGSGVVVHTHTPERDLAALKKLAQWALRVSPRVAVDPPDGLLLDVSGCDRLYKNEERLVRRLAIALERRGVHARIALASTFTSARALARYAEADLCVVPSIPGATRRALEELPVPALGIEHAAVEALAEVGVKTIGEVLRLPRSALPARFGDELLLALDRALGESVEVVEAVKPETPLVVERLFDGPTTQIEAIELAAHGLLEEMASRLREQERGVQRLVLELERPGAEPVRMLLTLGRPSRHVKHLWALLRPRLQAVHMGFGIERLELTALRTGVLRHEQSACWRTGAVRDAASDAAFWELADTLVARLGRDGVVCPETRSTYVPERLIRWRPVADKSPDTPDAAPLGRRPSLLLETPEEVEVLAVTPDGPVVRVTYAGVPHAVVRSEGPERISPEWWRTGVRDGEPAAVTHETRDYFTVHTDAARTWWVYRELGSRRWFLHGEWA